MTARTLGTRFSVPLPLPRSLWLCFGLASALACTPTDGDIGTVTGGAPSTGGVPATGGVANATGGVSSPTGGSPATGGIPSATGGLTSGGAAGSPVVTGGSSSGGSGGLSGGAAGSGGTAAGNGGSTSGTGGVSGGGRGGASNGGGGQAGGSTGGKSGSGGSTGGGGAGGAAGGAGAAGAAGSGGAGEFKPCPTNGEPCKILPLGDSITWGIQYDGAYRVELFNKAVGAGQKITFTGSLSNGPTTVAGMTFPKKNEGHSGWTIDQDAGLVPSPAFSTVPNIVLLMIGTNDVYAASGQSTMPNRLGSLLDKIIAAAPNALLVVAKITPLSNASWNNTIKTYNDAIPGLVQTRVAAGKHVIWVDMNTGFTSSMLSTDGVHPNKSGYDFMGGVWYMAISALLPK